MRRLAVLLLLVTGAAFGGEYRIDRPHPVEDPAYGEVLFHYYQQRYFAAMTEILVGLETGALPMQKDRARVLLGALYASYGMPAEAEALFEELLAEAVDPELASRVWLHLAGLYYEQQRYSEALQVLDTRASSPPPDLLQSWLALRTRVLMKLGRYADTASALDAMPGTSVLSGYLTYNLAVSRINAGQGEEGEALLWRLANLMPGDAEVNSLKDKAILALGVHYLRSGNAARAREVLGAARLEGPFSETGLLLHARAWLASEEPRRALGSLLELSARSMQHEEAQEAALALPWVYEQLGDFARAQQAYRDAIQAYTEHYRYLGGLEAKIRSGQWFTELLQEPAWSTAMDPLPPFEPNRVESFATFRRLFATHPFHRRWRDYHEQLRQIHLLEQWQHRLPALDELLAAHVRKYRAVVPEAEALLAEFEALDFDAELRALERRFEQAVEARDLVVFADDSQARLLAELAEARRRAEAWPERLDERTREKLVFYQRVLQWEIESDLVPRQWEKRRVLDAAESELTKTHAAAAAVDRAASGDHGRITELGHQLAGLHNDVVALERRGEGLLGRQQNALEALALEQVEFNRARLRAFTAECWAALGDLQNRVLRERFAQPPTSGEEPGAARSAE